MSGEIYKVTIPGAREKFLGWIADRGGVVVWRNQDLGNMDRGDMFAPLRDNAGHTYPKPHWAYGHHDTVTDINRFKFATMVECGRCKIALDPKIRDMKINLTSASTRRVRGMQSRLEAEHKTFEELEAVFERAVWDDVVEKK